MTEERIEYGTLEPVPDDHRDIGFLDMLATWIGANGNNGTWFIGGVVAGAAFGGAVLVTLVANPIAYLIMALIGYIGFKAGVGTMALTRPSFGIRGSYLPSVLNATQFIGWTAVNTFIASISISFIAAEAFGWPAYGQPGASKVLVLGILIMSVLHLISVAVGHHSVKIVERIGVVLLLILGMWESVVVIQHIPLHEILTWQPPAGKAMPLGSAMDAMAAFSLGWVPAIAEFTRYTKNKSSAMIAPMIGANISLFWFAGVGILGAIGTAIITGTFDPNNSDPSTIATKLGLGVLALVVIVLTSTTANAVNLMAAGMSLSNIFPKLKAKHAVWSVTVISAFVTLVPVFLASFLNTFIAFLDYIGMVFAPVFAIMIIDFFTLKKRKYHVRDLDRRESRYWFSNGVNWTALGVWVLGVVVYFILKQIPWFIAGIGATYPTMLIAALVYWIASRNRFLSATNPSSDHVSSDRVPSP
ncbi:Permease for cytosine/purines, uracil, thiamine, allantoin [Acididesulfobacillus acetoxydans]|uniref:Permease for cytosine/purines, uracil, thiamine, allantoin n=1 Tax=Acididesulfobacillus acetoxydans TaxID=1561005 RepID=A0A8S0W2S2_9FIRM|nr:cytosine permease [Acididesulfobacillus acetoxydans]CAA7600938.1 Permease for cytosine/purines, uracil, thiamine, allantoin [Acididesulfobacillus acetoxydans]CEJ08906.1 Purine-cytosine transporter [Acididesulfobacillus acetoxydans]